MKRLTFLILSFLLLLTGAKAQKDNFSYQFYGFVRGDLYYNSRSNYETVDGVFYLYPKDEVKDPNGKDLNANPNSSFYSFCTRLGLDIAGPRIGSAQTSAKIETDLSGTTSINFMLRIRHAYAQLKWENGSTLLLGQTWHPLFGEVKPDVLNLATGSPFQPFNRSPQIRYKYQAGRFTLTGSAIYQLIYKSEGPSGKSEEYQKNGVLPELYAGIDYSKGNFLAGVGIDMLSLKPRLQSVVDNEIYKVDERITTFSYEAHARYATKELNLAAKTLLASNLTHTSLLGGYGVTAIDPVTGQQDYTPFRHSTTWVNATYGTKWQGGLFAGYTKNLGTDEPLVGSVYGGGLQVDQLKAGGAQITYNLPNWTVGIEYLATTADYGTIDNFDGKVRDTHGVTNHRVLCTFFYRF